MQAAPFAFLPRFPTELMSCSPSSYIISMHPAYAQIFFMLQYLISWWSGYSMLAVIAEIYGIQNWETLLRKSYPSKIFHPPEIQITLADIPLQGGL
jgi:hypothetical protein